MKTRVETDPEAYPPDVTRLVEMVSTDITRLRQLVDDLLEISRLEAQAAETVIEPVALGTFLEQLVRAHGWSGYVVPPRPETTKGAPGVDPGRRPGRSGRPTPCGAHRGQPRGERAPARGGSRDPRDARRDRPCGRAARGDRSDRQRERSSLRTPARTSSIASTRPTPAGPPAGEAGWVWPSPARTPVYLAATSRPPMCPAVARASSSPCRPRRMIRPADRASPRRAATVTVSLRDRGRPVKSVVKHTRMQEVRF